MTTAVILAGGYGTRLRPLTFNTPKALIPLVNKPVIDYILDYLVLHGLKEFVITTNYLREQTIDYLNTSRADLKIAYPEEPSPLGTAGSVKKKTASTTTNPARPATSLARTPTSTTFTALRFGA